MEAPEVIEMKKNFDNKEYVKMAVSKQGKLLEWAEDSLKDDFEVVKLALENDGEAMEFASYASGCEKGSVDGLLCIGKIKK